MICGRTTPTLVDYSRMTPEQIGDHMLDDDNLARFVDIQFAGLPRSEWDWTEATRRVWALSGKKWLMHPQTMESIYDRQVQSRVEQRGCEAA